MKIAFVLNSHYSYSMGGAEYQASLIYDHIKKDKSSEVYYLCRNSNSTEEDVITVGSKTKVSKYAYFFDAISLYKALKRLNPDVIYHRNGGAYTGICAYYCDKNNAKLIWNLAHDKDVTPIKPVDILKPFKFIDKLLLEFGVRKANTIISQTIEQQELLRTNYGIVDSHLIANFHPKPIEKRASKAVFRVLWVANLKPAKQPDKFIELALHFKNSNEIEFVMVGKFSSEYKILLDKATEQDNFSYLGQIEQSKVNALIANADLFINTSLSEGFANTFIQSWLRGVPVVSMHVDPSQLIKQRQLGMVTPTVSEMKDTINQLLENPKKFEEMGERARVYAEEHHSIKNIDKIKKLMGY